MEETDQMDVGVFEAFGYSQHFYISASGGTCNVRRSLRVLAHLAVLWRATLLRLRRGHLERLLEIGNDIVRDELEVVDDLTASVMSTLDPEREHATKTPGEVLLGKLVALVTFESREQLLGSEGIQRCTEIPQNLYAQADNESDGAKCVPELQAVVAIRRLSHLGEALPRVRGSPVKLTRIDDDTADGGRQKYPPAPNVLSTMTGTPASCATLQIASKSGTLYLGLPIVSTYTAFVFSSIAFLKSSALSPDTNLVVTPSRGIKTLNWLAATPPSRAAMRFSKTSTVGFMIRDLVRHLRSCSVRLLQEFISKVAFHTSMELQRLEPGRKLVTSHLDNLVLKLESLLTLPALPCAGKVKLEMSWEVLSSLAVNASGFLYPGRYPAIGSQHAIESPPVPEEAHYCKRDQLFAKSKFCCVDWCHLTSLRQHRITPSPSLL
ncbi:Homocysteine [Hortaea werneckii]|nr:Homocysteine [Hortaea werneckii]